MSLVNNIINEFDIALKTLSNKKSGTGRSYPADSVENNTDSLTQKEKDLSIQMMRVNLLFFFFNFFFIFLIIMSE